jgi:hypothetical protein
MTPVIRSLGLGLVLAAASVSLAAAQGGSSRYDGQYVGALTLDKTIEGDCEQPPPGAQYPLKIASGTVSFDYLPRFGTTLTGTIDAAGNFRASAQIAHGTVRMTGGIQGRNVTAQLRSPSCLYTFRTE